MFKRFLIKLLTALGIIQKLPGIPPQIEVPEDGKSHPAQGELRTVKLGIIVGHTKNESGADFYNGTNEYAYNTETARLMELHAPRTVKHVTIFRDGIGIAGAYQKAFTENCDCVIELHCNAFNGKARGTLVYTSAATEDIEFSREMQKAMVAVFGTQGRRVDEDYGRGVQVISRQDRGGGNVYSFNGMANCLVEPAFCDNKEDCQLLLDLQAEYAKALVNAVELWAKKKDLI